MQLQTQQAVRTVQGSLRMNGDKKRRDRLAAAVYLAQLAEQVRLGEVVRFELAWDGRNLETDIVPRESRGK